MYRYPKRILTIAQQIQAYIDAGMKVSSVSEAEHALKTIGYYRLRGYCFHLYDNSAKQYLPGTDFNDIVKLYRFDTELSHTLFKMLSKLEVALRARLVQALLVSNDALILNDPSAFSDKKMYWQNQSTISAEIARSNDVFIKHNFDHHDGAIPLWAAVEIMSFGTLSKVIKNLRTGVGSAFSVLADDYKYISANGNEVKPSKNMLSSWIHAVSVLRNMCAHNSRIYNRAISTSPELITTDVITPKPQYNGLYQVLLAMKYLRPSDEDWNSFYSELQALFGRYGAIIDLVRMNFPVDWTSHFTL